MVRNVIILSSFFLLLNFETYAQNDWQEGFIVENSGDSIVGLIDYRSPKSNSNLCYFKKNKHDLVKKYSPKEIKGYVYINGKHYVSKIINIKDFDRTVFLEYLVNGKADVYYLGDYNNYYLEKDKQLYILENTEAYITKNSKDYIKDRNEYIGVMNYLFDNANISTDINKSKLQHKSLINIAKKYHNKVCEYEACIVYEKNIKPLKVDFGLTYGVNNKTLILLNKAFYDLEEDISHYFGIAFNFRNLPYIYERFSLNLELLTYEYQFNENKKRLLNVPLSIDYKLAIGKVYPKVEIGTSMSFIRNKEYNTQNMTLMAGISINYEFYKDYRIYFSSRYERRPAMLRFSGGVMF